MILVINKQSYTKTLVAREVNMFFVRSFGILGFCP